MQWLPITHRSNRLFDESDRKSEVNRSPSVVAFALICVISATGYGPPIASAQNASNGTTTPRKIPVRRYSGSAVPASRVLKEKPGEQPGVVTSIEIRNEAGELIDGTLDENEYFLGAEPMPINVGQKIPARVASSPSTSFEPDFNGDMEYVEIDDGIPLEGPAVMHDPPILHDFEEGACDSCGEIGRYGPSGHCDSCRPHHMSVDPRVERIARVLAHPLSGFWARAEYMHLILDGQMAPPLVTTSTAGTLREDAGVLGLTSTTTLFGGNKLGDEERSGGRFEIGRYYGDTGLGISASFLFAEDVHENFSGDSVTYGILARPFVDVSPGGLGNDAELVGFPGELIGDVDVRSSTSFHAGDVLLRGMLLCNRDRELEGFFGYTYIRLDDDLSIHDFKRVVGGGGGLAINTTLDETDRFATENNFDGAAFGIRGQTCFGRWSLATMMKLGLGVTRSTITASGSTTTSVPTAGGTDVSTRNTGLLVQDSNAGTRDDDEFAVAPEIRLVLNRRFNRDWSISVGYQLLYLSRVIRAGEQIDPLLNLTALDPGGLQGYEAPRRDAFYNDLTAQAITFGLLGEF
ncbi:BBP7 family outer membrane beta-barrel protein [Aporhodopirellula aestuarii]|uniref:BBP7 family outer membrane beta-barrel protein n=1 Tax=Aporhodopirellula aestuarii TaxID=2950107 RepID=A0ABT0U885_9BACT|nr:BBP7 family outer membrane beta-barrel protein [Aporhodopirellula aestuarii]MCM2373098.1 BBP7 family outer membrane beta-barrel protein [Aporhodopirellula aestuarii]